MPTRCTPARSVQMTTKTLKRSPNQQTEITLTDGFFEIKELTLANHIDTLKRIASEDSNSQNFNSNSNAASNCLPMLFNVQNNNSVYSDVDIANHNVGLHLYNKSPQPLSWTTDPASLPGNLRREAKFGNLSIEEVGLLPVSRGSSISDKPAKVDQEECTTSAGKVSSKGRRKSLKSGKKKSAKKKGSTSVTPVSVFPKVSKDLSTSLSSHDIDGLSALCSSVVIHTKTEPAKVKKSQEISKSKQLINNPGLSQKLSLINSSKKHSNKASHDQKQSFASKSLNNAIVEYNKKNQPQTSLSVQPKKKSISSSQKEEITTQPRKIYLSEKQSGVIAENGTVYPCAPPATPTAEQARKYNYVPSLHDIRAQRSFRQRLQFMENKVMLKERKKEEDNIKIEQATKRERKLEFKRRQRLEIYALNKVMTDLELDRFHQFMSSKGEKV